MMCDFTGQRYELCYHQNRQRNRRRRSRKVFTCAIVQLNSPHSCRFLFRNNNSTHLVNKQLNRAYIHTQTQALSACTRTKSTMFQFGSEI